MTVNMKKTALTASFVILIMLFLSCNAAPILKFRILGLDKDLLKSVTAQLQLKQETIVMPDDSSVIAFYREAPQEISKVLKLQGYFKSTVVAGTTTHKKNKWESTFKVNLGPSLKIVAIDLRVLGNGAADEKIRQRLQSFPLKKGEIFRTDRYNAAKKFLFNLADAYGYANAFLVVKKVLIDLEKNTAAIILHLDTGPQYYFGSTNFTVPFFSKVFLAKFLPYKLGDVYSTEKLSALHDVLNNSNFFQQITINPQIDKNKAHEIPIEVVLIPRKAKQYNVGVGFSTDSGLRGSLGMEWRYLTPNAHSFKGEVRGSQVQQDLELHYLIPGKYPVTDLYDFNLASKTINLNSNRSLTIEAGASYTTVLKGWRQTIKLSLQHEHHQLVSKPYASSVLLIPSINWSNSKSDDPIKPTNGRSINLALRGANKYLMAKNSFFQAQTDTKYIKMLSPKIQMVLRAALGFTVVDDVNNLPLALQFYTGGTQSIRGFGYNVIGPGRNFMVGSAELRHQIIGDWYVATFFDAGNANNDLFKKLNRGVGAGIVLRTIIGTLELTYAKALSLPGTPGKIQFSLGPEL